MTIREPYKDDEEDEEDYVDEPDLGPDERDLDLLDGTWEQDYYSGRLRSRDWTSITVGISLLLVAAMVLSLFAVIL